MIRSKKGDIMKWMPSWAYEMGLKIEDVEPFIDKNNVYKLKHR